MTSFPCSKCKKECSAEFLGTYILVLFGAGAVIVSSMIKGSWALVFVAVIFGSTVMLAILLLGRHSGAHINPAVTIAHAFTRQTRNDLILPYLSSQALGAVVGAMTLRVFYLDRSVFPADLGSTELARGVSPIYGIGIEAIGTFLLCSAALTATLYVRKPILQASLVGGTLFVLILLFGPLTGASFNPARSLGPALWSWHWGEEYVYLLGPLLGAILSATLFKRLTIKRDNPFAPSRENSERPQRHDGETLQRCTANQESLRGYTSIAPSNTICLDACCDDENLDRL